MSILSVPKKRLEQISQLQNLSLTVRVTVLCVGLSAAVILTLTVLGYYLALTGLRDQAQATLSSDALVAANLVDEWHTNRLETLQTLARLNVIQRFMEATPVQRAQYQDAVTDALTSVDSVADDMDSVALMDASGAFVASSNPKDLGQSSPQRDYFQSAMQGKIFITGVSISTITNAPSVFHSAPVKDANGKIIGVIRSRSSLDYVMQVVEAAKNRVGVGGTGVLLDQDGLVIASSVDAKWLLRPAITLKPDVNAAMVKDKRWGNGEQPAALGETDLAQAIAIGTRTVFSWHTQGNDLQAVALPLQMTRWSYVAAVPVSTFNSAADYFRNLMAGVDVVALALAAALALWGSRSITRPLQRAVLMMQELGKGHFGLRLNLKSQDEIGLMARTMDQFADTLQNSLNVTLNRIADGDLSVQVKFADAQDEIAIAEQKIVEALCGLVAEVQMLTRAAVEGSLSTRADPRKFQGGYYDIVQGVNDTLDAVIGPLNAAAGYVDRISKGDIPERITAEYKGDLNDVKNNLNQCIDAVTLLTFHTNQLARAGSEGKLSFRADASKHQGDFRKIVEGMNVTLDSVISPINDTKEILGRIAQGDLAVKMNGNYKGDFVALRDSIQSMVFGLKGMAGQSQQSAVSMTSSTAEILASSTQMASTTREQASAVNQVSSTVQEIKASAEQVAQRAQSVAEQANQATQVAQRGIEAVGAAKQGMDDIRTRVEAIAENILALSEQTQQIGEIIDTVTDIAGQSNILALNAAIEAAQAGEAGKGFRVVADEVRSLAEQSRQAAAQVKTILGDIQKATNQAVMATEQGTKGVQAGSEQVRRTAQTIEELARVVEASSQAAQQIVAGVEQQTIGLDQIVIGMNDINQAAQQSAAGAQQSQKAAQDLNDLAGQLKQVVAQYKM